MNERKMTNALDRFILALRKTYPTPERAILKALENAIKEGLSKNGKYVIGVCSVCRIDIYEEDTSFCKIGDTEIYCVNCWRTRRR